MASLQSIAGYESALKTVQATVEASIEFYRNQLMGAENLETLTRREQLSVWVRKFHEECGTLTPGVEDALNRMGREPCLIVVAAHQPNFFPYSGVIRKATLTHVLAQKLAAALDLPAVSIFAFADQDFTDDRWVKSTQIPDVQRRGGVFEMRIGLPDKIMLNQVPKPSKNVLAGWRSDIDAWLHARLKAVEQSLPSTKMPFGPELEKRFEEFWGLVEEAYEKAGTYADINAFLLSRVVNQVWGYDTLFCRFSESQRIFENEFDFLLSRFAKYSQHVKETTISSGTKGGVYEQEYLTIPFWYHCDCGSKVRLIAVRGGTLIGRGQCLRCGKAYDIDLGPEGRPKLAEISARISARSLAMPLVFLNGLKACCYVGGVGGSEYLRQAEYVARNLGIAFPPVVVWRPRDTYNGIGQWEALMTYKALAGSFDLEQCPSLKAALRMKIDGIQKQITDIESEKNSLRTSIQGSEEKAERIRAFGVLQERARRENNLPILSRNLGLLSNVESVMSLYPSVIDFAINVGLKETSDQWMRYLNEDGNLLPNVTLKTSLDQYLPESFMGV